MSEYAVCRECSALVDSTSRHRRWHEDLNRKIEEAEREAKRARRAARGS